MENLKFESLKQFPSDFLSQVCEILNDDIKFKELEIILGNSGLTFESSLYKTQFTIQSQEELKFLKDFLNRLLIPA